jgi:hypothetical protein
MMRHREQGLCAALVPCPIVWFGCHAAMCSRTACLVLCDRTMRTTKGGRRAMTWSIGMTSGSSTVKLRLSRSTTP